MQLLRWQSHTALTLSIAMVASVLAPLGLVRNANAAETRNAQYQVAQIFPDSWRNDRPNRGSYPDRGGYRSALEAGTVIPTRYEKEKIVVTPEETTDLTLTVDRDIRSSNGSVLIPEGSQIEGKLRPANDSSRDSRSTRDRTWGGTQFVAEEVILDNGDRHPIDATSDVITRRETITERSNPRWFEGVAIGAVAASVLGEIFGEIELWQVLGGAGVGALGSLLIRNRDQVEVIVIDPATDLNLYLDSDFEPYSRSPRTF